ncbi:serine hydrolase-like protein isoform X2 [Dendroctonus ponderosae]|nr:serine hydrolase-like protein isoform X2 [Dendroctonus ponderosae]XP_048519488.1 serine hydrolase-like protein isoform X2 [Dendroctonus ponderosae]
MDNAGSFDDLIPLLPKYFYICMDLPGHGKSDPLPPILPIHSADYLLAIKVVVDYFQRDKYIYMGHSYGGQMGMLFSRLYPHLIEKLILLDTLHFVTKPADAFKSVMITAIEETLELDRKTKTRLPPQYTYEEAVQKVMQARRSPISERAAKNLLKRSLKKVGEDKFELTIDQRLKFVLSPLHDNRYAIEVLKSAPLQCPVLIILGEDSKILRSFLLPVLEHLKRQKCVKIVYVKGDHDVHQVTPERVAPFVCEFLNYNKSKL